MRISNDTEWESKGLKKLFSKCRQEVLRIEGRRWELLKPLVSVVYQNSNNQSWIGGHAPQPGTWLTMKLPLAEFKVTITPDKKELDFSQCVADTYFHEVGHNLNVHHNGGHNGYGIRTMEHLYRQFILDNISNEKYPIVKTKLKPIIAPIIVDVRQKRYEQALKRKDKAEHMFKRAKALFDKWNAKTRYYERSFAMAKSKPND